MTAIKTKPSPTVTGANRSNVGVHSSIAISLILLCLIIFTDPAPEIIGIYVVSLTISLLIFGVPIGVGMMAAGGIGIWKMSGMAGLSSTFRDTLYDSVSNWSYSVIPTFVLMGMVLWQTGLTKRAFDSVRVWVGRLPGGLALATNFSGAGLAAASGSSMGVTYALGRVAIPEMLRSGYSSSLATASVAMVGTLGQMIPPSILLVIYAGVAQTPVGPQLMAGVIPGIILAVAYGVLILIRAIITPDIAPVSNEKKPSLRVRVVSLKGIAPVATVVLVVIGGIGTGWFTPTEAGAFGALAAIGVGWIYIGKGKRAPLAYARELVSPLAETAKSVTAIFVLIIGVTVLTRALALSQVPRTLTNVIVDIGLSSLGFLLSLVVVFLVLGMFLDPLAIILLTVPILIDPLNEFGISLIWFGIFVILMSEIAQVSPPIGVLSFVVHRIAQDPLVNEGKRVSLVDVFKGIIPFSIVALICLGIFIMFPELVLWLPESSGA